MNRGSDRDDRESDDRESDDRADHERPGRKSSSDASPYQPPHTEPPDRPHTTDPSVFHEPWMRGQDYQGSGEAAQLRHDGPRPPNPENSVWDEPGLASELSGQPPSDAVTWFRWYEKQKQQTSASVPWIVTFLAATVSGLAAVLGAVFVQSQGGPPLVVTVIAAPITEEILKVAIAIWICEKRPWLFSSPLQILACGLASGVVFACIENLLYLHVYLRNPGAGIVAWRWTVCTLLHASCSTVASLGIVAMWTKFRAEQRAPRLADGSAWFAAAMILHGTYNFIVTLLESSDFRF